MEDNNDDDDDYADDDEDELDDLGVHGFEPIPDGILNIIESDEDDLFTGNKKKKQLDYFSHPPPPT